MSMKVRMLRANLEDVSFPLDLRTERVDDLNLIFGEGRNAGIALYNLDEGEAPAFESRCFIGDDFIADKTQFVSVTNPFNQSVYIPKALQAPGNVFQLSTSYGRLTKPDTMEKVEEEEVSGMLCLEGFMGFRGTTARSSIISRAYVSSVLVDFKSYIDIHPHPEVKGSYLLVPHFHPQVRYAYADFMLMMEVLSKQLLPISAPVIHRVSATAELDIRGFSRR